MPPARLTFGRALRLTGDAEFRAVFGARVKKSASGLTVYARPNGRACPRLGLSVRKGAGGAAGRNRVKRLVREAFRQVRHRLPRLDDSSYDFIVGAGPLPGMTLDQVRGTLEELIGAVHSVHQRRAQRRRGP